MTVKDDWENGEQFNASDANAVAEAVNAAYVKPGTGVPITDLTSGVQLSLGKADTAVQSVTSTSITDSTTTGRAVITATDASAARTTLGVSYGSSAGTVVEGNDSRLTPSSTSITDSTATGRSVLTAVDPAAARTTLGVAYGSTGGTVAQGNDSRIVGAEQTSAKGVANGYASLDGGGKVPVGQLPSSIMQYQGTFNASTGSPALANGTGDTGDVYRVTVAGSQNFGAGSISFEVGDYVIYNGTVWEKSDTTDAVSTVAGLTGDVTASSLRGAIATGTPSSTTWLRGDGAWETLPASGITRSVQTLTAPTTTLGAAPNTDYVAFVGMSTTSVNTIGLVGTTVSNFQHAGGPSTATHTFTHTTAAATLLIVCIYHYQGYSLPVSVTVSNNGTPMTELPSSKVTGANFGPGTAGGNIQTFATLGTIGATNNFTVTMNGSSGNYQNIQCIAATYNATSIGTPVIQNYTASPSVTVNNASNLVVFSINNAVSSGAATVTDTATSLSQGKLFMSHNLSRTISNKTVTATNSAMIAIPVFNSIAPAEVVLPTAIGNTNQYTLKNITGSQIVAQSTSSQTIDGVLALADIDYPSVAALLHGEQSNGSTTILDSSPVMGSWTFSSGSISTSQSKFGLASISGRFYPSSPAAFAYPGDYTIEFFVRLNGNIVDVNLYDSRNAGTGNACIYITGGQAISATNGLGIVASGPVVSANTWHHVALCRSANSSRLFFNGTQVGSTFADAYSYGAHQPVFGGVYNSTSAYLVSAWYDEVRITKAARYTSNFTAPTQAFPDSAGSGVINSSATLRLISDGSNWRTV